MYPAGDSDTPLCAVEMKPHLLYPTPMRAPTRGL